MAKWLGWLVWIAWGLLCFLLFFHLLFPYEVLGRRILYTLEQKANVLTRPSNADARFLGIHWARVEVSYPRHKSLPPLEIRNWVIRLRPLSLLVGRLSATSYGALMGGSFHSNLVFRRKVQRGLAEWDGLRIDQLPLLPMEGSFFEGIVSGRARWEKDGEGVEGEAAFELRDGMVKGAQLGNLTLPTLDLGLTEGQLTWDGERINLKEISVRGKNLEGKLTGNVFYQIPFVKSKVACRLEIALSPSLLNRYPAIATLFGGRQGRPLVIRVHGTLENPRFSPAR